MAELALQQGPSDGHAAAFVALVGRAQAGDESVLPHLRDALRHPEVVEVLGGDLARRVIDKLLDAACGTNLAVREAIAGKMDLLRSELEGPSPSAVERLLADRVVAGWLHLHYLELGSVGLAVAGREAGESHQRAVDRAHRRYLSAIKALATVRKLALPALQVNIAREQVNLAGR